MYLFIYLFVGLIVSYLYIYLLICVFNDLFIYLFIYIFIYLFTFPLPGAHRRTGTTAVQQTFRLKKLFKHEGFDMRQLQNDIALLQLERPITASEKVNTVCLPAETRERRVTSQVTYESKILALVVLLS